MAAILALKISNFLWWIFTMTPSTAFYGENLHAYNLYDIVIELCVSGDVF